LIDVKAKPNTLPPRPANQTSIPALLTALQAEYDAIMLESLEIKKSHTSSRQELANALYREDAATRVIARLMKERDEAREALTTLQQTMGFAPQQAEAPAEDVEMSHLTPEVEQVINDTNQSLSSVRKKRKPAAGYATPDAVKAFTQTAHIPSLHATKPPGISALDLSGRTALTGGPDKIVQVFDLDSSKVLGTLKGHAKAVNHVAFAGEMAISGSADKTVRLWGEENGKWSAKGTLSGHKGEITGLAVHPSGSYLAAGSTDSTWSFYDLSTVKSVATYSAVDGVEGSFSYTSFAGHPDGILHGGGTSDGIRVWDVRQATSLAATLQSSNVNSLSFSENGYYLATSSSSSPTVSIFDLRKLAVISSWQLPSDNQITEVRFDTSAQFLSVVGTDLRVYANKTWDELYKFEENAGLITGARFGNLGGEIVLSGMDRSLRVLS